jgi:hypothetical protein
MLRRRWLILLAAACLVVLSCSKGSSPPTAPPPTAQCSLSTSTLDFGTVDVGRTADRSFVLSNTGAGTLSGTVTSPSGVFAIVHGTAYSLAAGHADTVLVRFAPTQAGSASCTLSTGTACSSVACSGTGRTPTPGCQVSASSLDFGTVSVGQSADASFTISNTGAGTLSGTVTSSSAVFTIVRGATYSLAGGQTDTVTVRFTPTQTGTAAATITTGGSCSAVACTGAGQTLSPDCQVSPTTIDFGSVAGGSTRCESFRITNTSATTIIHGWPTINVTQGSASDWSLSPQSYYLNPGEHADFTVCFQPHGVSTNRMTVVIPDRSLFCHEVECSGTGTGAPPVCFVQLGNGTNPPTLDFGTMALGQHTLVRTVTVKNTGGSTLSGQVNVPSADFVVTRAGGDTTLSYALTANQEASFWVTFAPAAVGPKDATLSLGSDACTGVRLLANAVPDPGAACQVIPTMLFPLTPGGSDAYLAVANPYSGSVSGQVYLPCAHYAFASGATLQAFAISPGGTLSWRVHYDGTYTQGDSCLFNTDFTGGSGCPPIKARVQGSALYTPIIASPVLLDFGAVPVGQSADLPLTLTNDTGAAVAGTVGLAWVGGLPCAEFQVVGSPSFSIPAAGSTTVTLRFQPVTNGPHDCALTTSLGSQVNGVGLHGTAALP